MMAVPPIPMQIVELTQTNHSELRRLVDEWQRDYGRWKTVDNETILHRNNDILHSLACVYHFARDEPFVKVGRDHYITTQEWRLLARATAGHYVFIAARCDNDDLGSSGIVALSEDWPFLWCKCMSETDRKAISKDQGWLITNRLSAAL